MKSQIRGCSNRREESLWLYLSRKSRSEAPIFEEKFEACSPVDEHEKDILGREMAFANFIKRMWTLQILLMEKVIDD